MTKHAHTAGWCQGSHSKGFNSVSLASTPDFIELEDWPSKSPDLNVMHLELLINRDLELSM